MLNAHMETRVEKLWVESGGRLEEETQYFDSHVGKDPDEERSQQVLLTTARTAGDNVLTPAVLNEHLRILKALRHNITITAGGADFTLNDICFKVDLPLGLSGVDAFVPCIRITIFDCFREGGFDFLLTKEVLEFKLLKEYNVKGYSDLPSFNNASTDIGAVVSGGCQGFARASKGMKWPEPLLLGGAKHANADGTGRVTHASALETVFLLGDATTVAERLRITEALAEEVLVKFRTAFLESIPGFEGAAGAGAPIDGGPPLTATTNYVLASDSLDRLLESVSAASVPLIIAGYAVMIGYLLLSLGREQLATTGLVSLVVVACATVGAFGFASIVGISFNASSTQVLPFLALGLGVDDLFVLAHMMADARAHRERKGLPRDSVAELGDCLSSAGPSVLLTSVSNFCSFLAASIIPMPAVQAFCFQAALVVAFNFLALVVVVPSVMTLLRMRSTGGGSGDQGAGGDGAAGAAGAAGSGAGAGAGGAGGRADAEAATMVRSMHSGGTSGEDAGLPPHGADGAASGAGAGAATPASGDTEAEAEAEEMARNGSVRMFVVRKYAPGLLSRPGQALVLLLTLGLLGVAAWGASEIEMGLDLEDIAPADTMEARFLDARFKYFSFFGGFIVTQEMDYPNMQPQLLQLVRDLEANPYVLQVLSTWIEDFTDWVNATSGLNAQGLVPPATFYRLLNKWTTDRPIDAVIDGAPYFGSNAAGGLDATLFTFYMNDVDTTDEFVALIESVRAVCTASPVPCFPAGVPFQFWEQYVHLKGFLLQGVLVSLAAVFVVSMLMLSSVIAPIFVCSILAMTVFEVYGLLGVAAIKLSAVPATSIIMALGVALEFTAHLMLAFLNAHGATRVARIKVALGHMFVPILDGGLSTFVGIIVLAFSDFGFVRKYFFGVFFAVIIVGLFNGLAVLPVLLSIAGPPAYTVAPNGDDSEKEPPGAFGRGSAEDASARSLPASTAGVELTAVGQQA